MKRILMLTGACLLSCLALFAQSPCGNELLEQKLLRTDPRFALQKEQSTAAWSKYNAALALSKMVVTGKDTVYEIPVVVHIVHLGGAVGSEFNPTDADIVNLVDYLNKTWAATWFTYADTFSKGTRIPVKFILAKRDPACNVTTGINRVNGAVLSGYEADGICPFGSASGPSDEEVKTLSLWPTRDYFNIWLVNEIEGGTVGGYAPWPWFTAADLIDGAVICTQYARKVGTDYYSALPHELGHSFGLYHTFQEGCDPSGSCLTSGDQLCDTEPHTFDGMDCDAGKLNSCTGVLYKGVEHNFMNYSTCVSHFTKDQRKRILFTINGYRTGLVNSMGGTAPSPGFVAPKAACVPGISNSLNGQNVGPCNIQFANMSTSSSGYTDDRSESYIDRTCIQAPVTINKGAAYPISISTIEDAQNVRAWIDYNNDGIFQSTELVFSHNGLLPADEVHSGTVTVPTTGVVTNTNLRMRIRADVSLALSSDPCTDVQYGQTEDYTVIIAEKPISISTVAGAGDAFRIFPNPATDKVSLLTSVPAQFFVYSVEGKLLLHAEHTTELSISGLASGVYFIQAHSSADGSLIGVQKLVKAHR